MTWPAAPTIVLYPSGTLAADARVLHVEPVGDALAVVADSTPVHPVDAAWPDQPADRAVLRIGAAEHPLLDAVVGATDGRELRFGAALDVRPGAEGWVFVVVHLVDPDAGIASGDTVHLEVDAGLRRALSRGHTACHLASLALNRALADTWRKPAPTDALGAPDFDRLAIDTSTIVPGGSVDRYRVGKSARKAGIDPDALADPAGLARVVERTLAEWTAAPSPVRIEVDGPALTDRRTWVCDLPDGEARIPCGGTHVESTADLRGLRVQIERTETPGALLLEMRTTLP